MTAPALAIVMTQAGHDAFTAAQGGGDIDLTISQVGITDQQFVVAPTLTELPGEFKRLDTVSGEAVGDNILHLVIRDQDDSTYQVTGFGLFLADGTLFAVYGQADAIFEKSTMASMYVAIDMAFPTGDVSSLSFGDTNFLNPPATTETKGVIELATEAEARAGVDTQRGIVPATLKAVTDALLATVTASIAAVTATLNALLARTITGSGLITGGGDLSQSRTLTVTTATAAEAAAGVLNTKAVTPAALATIITNIAAKVPLTRHVDTTGLLTGGGDLSADRTLSVVKATAAMVLAGTDDASAVTPAALGGLAHLHSSTGYQGLPGGLMLQWGHGTAVVNGISSHTFPLAFSSICFTVVASGGVDGGNEQQDNGPDVIQSSITNTGFQCFSALDSAAPFGWIAVGK